MSTRMCDCGKVVQITEEQRIAEEEFSAYLDAGNVPCFVPWMCDECRIEMDYRNEYQRFPTSVQNRMALDQWKEMSGADKTVINSVFGRRDEVWIEPDYDGAQVILARC